MRYEIDVAEYGTILIGRTPNGCISLKITDSDDGGEYDIEFTESEIASLLYAIQLCKDAPAPTPARSGVWDRGIQDR